MKENKDKSNDEFILLKKLFLYDQKNVYAKLVINNTNKINIESNENNWFCLNIL